MTFDRDYAAPTDTYEAGSLFEPFAPELPPAQAAREEAIQRVEENAPPSWNREADATIRAVAARGEPFTADDLWEAGLEKPPTPAALGPVFLRAAKAGLIRKTGRLIPTRDPVRHRDLTEWEKAA